MKKPSYTTTDVFNKCISRVRKRSLKKKFNDVLPYIEDAAVKYEVMAENQELHLFSDDLCNNHDVTIKEMETIYTERMVDKASAGRGIYDEIMSLSINWTCPACGQRKVSSLDHYLPKAFYPSLVVTPFNLIPSCDQCNKKKLDRVPESVEESTLHPYYDEIGNDRFLFSRVIKSTPPVIDFYIKPPETWDEIKAKRVQFHFETFELNFLYRVHAVDEIMGQIEYWNDLSKSELSEELSKQARSRSKFQANSWQTAFYEGMSKSPWFCDKGFNQFLI
ncbi:HNH endonuclease [Paenibacillus endoradicis]|uniref:HNH endonuclease n=1 Tax=Paenibacillus endoradicis TaxID=2972487 RepID=UPI002159A422|nr:hypothetical protein [Paenibacillus endoradicis]MCR8659182.1 hypothetical protein [Paenibacillus endoradicis]